MHDVDKVLNIKFNIAKCGSMNIDHTIFMGETIPSLPSYKYLGSWANGEKLVGLTEAFDMVKNECELIMNSSLTPMQKLHAVRTHAVPKV